MLLFGVVCTLAMSEFFFTLYTTMTGSYNLLGHIYKAIAYLLIYRAVVVEVIESPYRLLELSMEKFRILFESTKDTMLLMSMDGRIVDINPSGHQRLGYSKAEMLGRKITEFNAPEFACHLPERIADIAHNGQTRFESVQLCKDGARILVEVDCKLIELNHEKLLYSVIHDITQRQKIENELRIAATAFETHEAIMITDANANILRVNQAFQNITGYSAEEVLNKNPRILSSGHHDAAFYAEMWQQLLKEGKWIGEIWDKRKNGQTYPKWMTLTAVKNKEGSTTGYVAMFSDITERKKSEQEIYSLAFYDVLTNLPNRRHLMNRLQQAQAISARSNLYGALIYLDMDRFKNLNDTLGHDHGDLFLIEVSQRLSHCVRDIDAVARIGGDEFVVLMEEIDANAAEASRKIALVAEKIRAALSQAYRPNQHEHHSSPSIGVCLYYAHEESIDTLLKHADMAMYKAKESGGNAVRFFDPAMQLAVENHASLESDMRHAIQDNQLHLYYQIQMDDQQRAIGAEALIRWIHPVRGMVSPAQFIPIAEESFLISDIGHWVLNTACQQLQLWQQQAETRHLTLAVNVSAPQFMQHDFVENVLQLIKRYQINPKLLKLELTEAVVLDDVTDIINKMNALKVSGIRLSLDDFGTGYSSLAYLKKLPLDQIKIDQSFVRDISTDPSDAVMVKTIIDMAESFQLNVIAEGVENEAQLSFLKQHGCSAYQGYLFSKPVPIAEFESLLKREKRP